jgi:glyoxylase-like metal-dependent hydrolase (beta-lactamase superfamily II)
VLFGLGAWIDTVTGVPVLKNPTVAVVACGGLLESKRKLYNVPQRNTFAFWFSANVCELHVIATPGHTADSVSLLVPADGAVLTGDTVLDPFCGTATTMVAALKHGRNSIGVELDTEYCKMAASRLLNENSSLFGHAQFQIELKPHPAVEAVGVLQEKATAYKTPANAKDSKRLMKSISSRSRKPQH